MESNKTSKKVLVIGIIILLLFGYAAWRGGYLASLERYILSWFELSPKDIPGWTKYRNEKYGFEFQYPKDVSVKDGGKGVFFRLDEPIVTLSSTRGDLFTVGVTTDIQKDISTGKYVLQSMTDVIQLAENCAKPFFGAKKIPSAEMSFGQGFESSTLYSIAMADGSGLSIETHNNSNPKRDLTKDNERKDLEGKVLRTLYFGGAVRPVEFTCKNYEK